MSTVDVIDGEKTSSADARPEEDSQTRYAGNSQGVLLEKKHPQPRPSVMTVSLMILAFLGMTHAMYIAAPILIPVASAFVVAVALRPIVRKLNGYRIPDALSAVLLLVIFVGGAGFLLSRLLVPASEWFSRTPVEFRLQEIQRKLAPIQKPLAEVNDASKKISEIAKPSDTDNAEEDIQEVVVKPPSFLSEVLSSSWQLTAGIFLSIVLTYFFLTEGNPLMQRLAENLTRVDLTHSNENVIDEVEHKVSTYLATVTVINIGLGIAVGMACWLIEVPSPLLWGVMACLLNFLPYVGALVGVAVMALVSLFSFDSIAYATIAPLAYLTLTSLEGYLITPSILGRSMRLNPLVVLLALTYWSWVWGIAGAVLAVPMLTICMVLFKQFDQTRRVVAIIEND